MQILLEQLFNGLVMGSLYALVAVGLTLIFGLMHIINWAHGEFYAFGAYFAYFVFTLLGVHYAVAVLAAMVLVMLLGAGFQLLVLNRLRHHAVSIPMLATIGLWIFLQNAGARVWGSAHKSIPPLFQTEVLTLGALSIPTPRLFAAAVAAILIVAAHLFLQKTMAGKCMRATFQDEDAAQLMGIRIERIHLQTFVLGAGLSAAAGALIGPIFVLHPGMGDLMAIKAFVVVVMGGMGSFMGAIAGGLILGLAESSGASYISAQYKDVFAFIIVILVLTLRPSGLFSGRFGKKEQVG